MDLVLLNIFVSILIQMVEKILPVIISDFGGFWQFIFSE